MKQNRTIKQCTGLCSSVTCHILCRLQQHNLRYFEIFIQYMKTNVHGIQWFPVYYDLQSDVLCSNNVPYNSMFLCLFVSAVSSLITCCTFYVHNLQGTVKIVEEYRNRSSSYHPLECYYLFVLNHDAACSVEPKHLSPSSPSSICLIM